MTAVAVRVYTCKKEKPIPRSFEHREELEDIRRVLVLDIETTVDQFQNLTFGSFKIYLMILWSMRALFIIIKSLMKNKYDLSRIIANRIT